MYQKPNTPLGIGGILDDGFRLYRASLASVFVVAAIAAVIANAPSAMIGNPATLANPEDFPFGIFFATLGFAMIVGLMFFIALIVRINSIQENTPTTWGEAFNVALKKFLPVVFGLILYVLVTGIGFLLIIPGIILGLSLILAPYLMVIDEIGPIDALKASHALIWGNWWRTAVIFGVITFILLAIYLLIGIVAAVSMGASIAANDGVVDAGASWVDLIVIPLLSGALTPAVYSFSLSILNDLKLRKEGGDLEDRIEAIET